MGFGRFISEFLENEFLRKHKSKNGLFLGG
jgi:hypothetical protein